jgi:hypothetical protein
MVPAGVWEGQRGAGQPSPPGPAIAMTPAYTETLLASLPVRDHQSANRIVSAYR